MRYQLEKSHQTAASSKGFRVAWYALALLPIVCFSGCILGEESIYIPMYSVAKATGEGVERVANEVMPDINRARHFMDKKEFVLAHEHCLAYLESGKKPHRDEALFLAGVAAQQPEGFLYARINQRKKILITAQHWHELYRHYPKSEWTAKLGYDMRGELEATAVLLDWDTESKMKKSRAVERLMMIINEKPNRTGYSYKGFYGSSNSYTYDLALNVLAECNIHEALPVVKRRLHPKNFQKTSHGNYGVKAEIDYLLEFEGKAGVDTLIILLEDANNHLAFAAIENMFKGQPPDKFKLNINWPEERKEFIAWWYEIRTEFLQGTVASPQHTGQHRQQSPPPTSQAIIRPSLTASQLERSQSVR